MKKSELVRRVNVPKLAQELGLSETDIKLAITHTPPKFDEASIEKIKTLGQAKRRFGRTNSPDTRAAILYRAISLCETLEDLWFVKMELGFEKVSSVLRLETQYSLRARDIVKRMLKQAKDFIAVHEIWAKLDSENFAEEDAVALQMMTDLIPCTDTIIVLENLEGDIGQEVYFDRHLTHHYLVVLACEFATPEQAHAALRRIREYGFDGKQNSLPVRLLIQKAAHLFLK